MKPDFVIIKTNWQRHKKQLGEVRKKVFVEEQQVPIELEWDEYDETSLHVLAVDNDNRPIGTGRLKADGQIGRMAVLADYRRQSIGSAILKALIEAAMAQGLEEVYLHAQISAQDFYSRHRFRSYGEPFLDAGIPHIAMRRTLV